MNLKLLASLLIGTVMLTGCAGYRLGSMLPDEINSVAVPTFVNRTKEPLLEVDCTQAAIEQFQLDGSLKVKDADEADAILEVVLQQYALEPLAFEKDRRTATKEYRMVIYCSLVMKRRTDGAIVAQYPKVRGEATFEVIGDLSSSKLQALPQAAADLAKNIVERVVEAWQ